MVTGSSVRQGGWTEEFHKYQAEIMTKIKKGETEEAIPLGRDSYTATEWKKIMKSVDQQIEDIREEQARRLQKREDRMEARRVFEAAASMSGSPAQHLREAAKVPYSHMARDGEISYNGVTFVCDAQTNSICLGDMTNEKNVLTIGLSGGGSLKVNRNSLGMLSKAIGMFSPEDVNRIMRAIAQDTKIQSMKKEIDDLEANVGNEITEGTETAEGDQQTKDRDLEEVS